MLMLMMMMMMISMLLYSLRTLVEQFRYGSIDFRTEDLKIKIAETILACIAFNTPLKPLQTIRGTITVEVVEAPDITGPTGAWNSADRSGTKPSHAAMHAAMHAPSLVRSNARSREMELIILRHNK